jgi:hypothetical protein
MESGGREMIHVTEEEFMEIQRMLNEDRTKTLDEPESKLVKDIVAFCKVQAWPCLSFPRTEDVKNFLTPGWWDITIKAPRGITLDIETKKVKGGRMSEKQKLMRNMCAQLGHTIHKIDTWKGFEELIERHKL